MATQMKVSMMVIVLAVLMVTACWDNPVEPVERENLSFSTVHQDRYSGIARRRGEVIVNAGRWEAVWQEMHSDRSPQPSLPPIDFGKETLVLAAMGEEGDACWTTEIAEVLAMKESLRVGVLEKRAPMSCACPAVVVHPVHVVRIPRRDRPASFSFDRVIAGGPCS